jgi:hypothetical protein
MLQLTALSLRTRPTCLAPACPGETRVLCGSRAADRLLGWLQAFEKKGGKGVPLGLGYALRCVLFGIVCLAVYAWALPIFSVENLMGPYRHWNLFARWAPRRAAEQPPGSGG